MNCSRCNAPLIEGARFCRNCGLPVQPALSSASDYQAGAASSPAHGPPYSPQSQGNVPPYAPTQPVSPMPYPQPTAGAFSRPQYVQGQPGQLAQPAQPTQAAPPIQQFGQEQQGQPGQYAQGQFVKPGRGARKRRWPLRVAIALAVLVVLVVGGWFLVARPIIHSYAQSQLDQIITSDVNQILPVPPPVGSLTASQTVINNLIVLTSSPSNPVQGEVINISPPIFASDGSYSGGVQLNFQLDGFPCSVTTIPQASNGNIIVTHLQVTGIISWVMSADELTADLNAHLQDVNSHLLRSISNVTIGDQQIDITLA